MKRVKSFPTLTEKQVYIFEKEGNLKTYQAQEVVIEEGERGFDFFIVLEGEVDIIDPFQPDTLITTHTKGEFTGDSDMLSQRASVFRAVAKTDCTLIRVPHKKLSEILSSYPDLNDILITAFIMRRKELLKKHDAGFTLLGSRFSPETYSLREFFSKNHLRYVWLDLEKDKEAEEILLNFNIKQEETPVIIDADFNVYRKPSLQDIARHTGISATIQEDKYDILIVGAGPGGLAASVYGASEGLKTITIDKIGPGGQAGNSSKIENYLGFPTGISGSELANRAYTQAQKFGCTVSVPMEADTLIRHKNHFELKTKDGKSIFASTVIAASGAKYRSLEVENIDFYKGRGVFYGATTTEANTCQKEEVAIVGGGNSAGQAAMFLATFAAKVHLIIRGDTLENSMSSYLIKRVENEPKIQVHINSEVTALEGEEHLEKVTLTNNISNEKSSLRLRNLFLFIGAVPASDWLQNLICMDRKGFVLTGNELSAYDLQCFHWDLDRPPYPLETSQPGLFAVGDLRSGSAKRVASSVGEGAMAISFIHNFFS
ncbi:FAD-dependent oxidoreductase [Pontibacter pamirensis]|uniref:FAD-dependent oxidoreductase n=1 Tax=Pontibacter pamirensis TaxID=2562824 RepID=UPI0013895108|nr:cyclic nucleotide-binding domain-containing thioredoxin-disulfide reductase [Pontibacter pamirensis]